MSNLVPFPSYIYQKEKKLKDLEQHLSDLEQEISFDKYELELEREKLRSERSVYKSKLLTAFLAGAVSSLLLATVTAALYI